jgi:hypothetical protein
LKSIRNHSSDKNFFDCFSHENPKPTKHFKIFLKFSSMKYTKYMLLATMVLLAVVQKMAAQSSPNCATASDNDYFKSTSFFNYGNVSNAYTTKTRLNVTVGQPVVGSYFAQQTKGTFGFWSSFLMPPSAPTVIASEGDLEDRVQISWAPDPLSPTASNGFNLYRNGALLASVDADVRAFVDFNVIAGKFYTYTVSGKNIFGEGVKGSALGFLNPNGVVTGQVKSFAGNPVQGTIVTLTPTVGTSGNFAGDDMAFAEYSTAFPRTQFTLSAWVKLGAGNDNAAIFDFGSTISKNWWLHTLPAADGKGIRFGLGNGVGDVTEMDYAFPAATANDWQNIAVSYNGASLLLYANGELISTAVASVAADSIQLFFGRKADETGFYTGKLDEVRFFDRQLSQTEIQMFLNRTVAPDMDGLVNYWKFDEGVGSKTFDLTASKQKVYFCGTDFSTDKPTVENAGLTNEDGFYAIPGINYGAGTTFTARPAKNFYYNQSLEFNGVNEQFATLTDFDLADSSTVEITVKGFDFGSNQSLLNKGSYFNLDLNAGNLVLTMGGTPYNFGALGMGFHRLSFTIEQATGSSSALVTFYKDGALVGSNTFSGVASDFAGGGGWLLGKNAGGNYFSGLIDEVVFYDALLSLPNIQLAANIGTDVTNINLKNYFPLNEGQGTSVKDYGFALSGNGIIDGAAFSTVAGITQETPHLFTPSSKFVTLNTSNTSVDDVDFIDQSTIPVSGYVRFNGTDCFADSVEILVNGKSFSPPIYTNEDGKFIVDLEPGATKQLSPRYKNHTFYPAFWDLEQISSPIAGILFRDMTLRSSEGQIAGGHCRKSVIPDGATAQVKVFSLNGCYERIINVTAANGKFKFTNLPPKRLTIALISHNANSDLYNYFNQLGGEVIDLTEQNDTTDFIYYSDPQIEMSAFEAKPCGAKVLNTNEKYNVNIRVYQDYSGGRCYLDTAALSINNLISDAAQFDTMMTEGRLTYRFQCGLPILSTPYLKTLSVSATANFKSNTASQQAIVTGERPRTTTFATTTPQLPLVVLRDPPGDASSAYLEKDDQVCHEWSFEFVEDRLDGLVERVSIGPNWELSSGAPGFLVGTDGDVVAEQEGDFQWGKRQTNTQSSAVCFSRSEVLTTPGDDILVGPDADIFMGGAMNLIFGITDKLVFDTATCLPKRDTGLLIIPTGFATTYIYTRYNILNEVIPSLILIGDTNSVKQWRNIIIQDSLLQKNASQVTFDKNYSFNGGISYEQSTTNEVSTSSSFGLGELVTKDVIAQAGFFANDVGASAGYHFSLNREEVTTNGTNITNTVTAGFVLSDDDPGDNFSVDVFKDKFYGTHSFKLRSGQSSCPYEKGSQAREAVELAVDHVSEVNVPENGEATFTFTLGNISESDDTREYLFSLIPESNTLGAVVKIQGGSPLDRPFGLAPYQGQQVTVTIERGPVAYVYEDLEFALFSECEDSRGVALGLDAIDPKFYKSIKLDVTYVESCSRVNIGYPLQDWVLLAPPANSETLVLSAIDYNKNDTDLELIRAQYRRTQGDGAWINIATIQKADLGPVFTLVPWNTADLQDGLYEVRFITQCTGGQNPGISKVMKGKIERTAPKLFGAPEPADGVLSRGDEISIRFNEPIRCDMLIQADVFDNNNIGLYDTETGNLVDAIISCQGDKIVIIPNVPNRFIEGKILRVEVNNIKDLADNVSEEKTWEFVVDRNPIRWEGDNVKVSKLKPQFVTVTRRILNDGGQATAWELEDLPTWARIYPTSGELQPGAAEEITFEFDSTLAFGNYLDTIRINAPEGKEPLTVNCRVMCESPDWQFSTATYPHTMNFSLKLDVEGTLSTDEEDIVAAFIDGEIRGTAKVQLLPTLPPLGTQYMAFLTVYGDADDDGKPVKLEIWDASACLRYGEVIEQFDFEVDNVIGNIGTPVVLHTNSMVRRDIPLTTGWNWISFNLLHPNPALNSALASLKYPANDLIKGRSTFAEYFGSSWVGSLSAINNRNMFQFRADQPDTIQMRGALIDPASLSIPIAAGWNWIGYVPNYPLTVTQALAGLTPLNGDIIKGQTSFAQYIAGFGWLGSLQFMEPPKGYQLKISIPGTLTYPPQPQNKQQDTLALPVLPNPQSALWAVDATQFEYSMTLIGMFEANGQNATLAGHEIGAFTASGELRGSAQAIYIEPLGLYEFFLTAFGNTSGEQLVFKLYDSTTGQIQDLAEKMYFVSDLHQGSISAPLPFTLKSSGSTEAKPVQYLEVQPNPFSDATTILFAADQAQEVQLVICDAIGRTVLSQKISAGQGLNTFRWDNTSSASAGVYFVRLETAEGTAALRVVKK